MLDALDPAPTTEAHPVRRGTAGLAAAVALAAALSGCMGRAPAPRPAAHPGACGGAAQACGPGATRVAGPGAVQALHVTSELDVAIGGVDHRVVAGSLLSNPRQGAVLVITGARPGCAPGAGATRSLLLDTAGQLRPSPRGELTLLRASGSVVVFRTASGDVGTFDVATGTFGPQG